MTINFAVSSGYGSGNYATGSLVNIIAYAPNPGSYFVGWSGAINCSALSPSSANTYAQLSTNPAVIGAYIQATYALIQYSLTYGVSGDGYISGDDSQSVAYGGDGTEVTAVANAGSHFVRWSDNNYNAARTDTNITSNRSFTAIFQSDTPTYVLTVTNGSGDGSYAESTTVAIAADAPAAGSHFDQWTGDITGVVNIYAASTDIVTQAIAATITATYALDSGLKKVAGVAIASTKKVTQVLIASVVKLMGISNE